MRARDEFPIREFAIAYAAREIRSRGFRNSFHACARVYEQIHNLRSSEARDEKPASPFPVRHCRWRSTWQRARSNRSRAERCISQDILLSPSASALLLDYDLSRRASVYCRAKDSSLLTY